jgi:hypothetical protein
MLDAAAAGEDKRWAALSTELNEQTAVKRPMRRASSPHSIFSMLRKCRYLGPDADDEAIVKFVAGGSLAPRNWLGGYGLL